MQFILATFASLLAASNAAGVFYCVNVGFTGNCQHDTPAFGACTNIANGFNDAVSAVGPDTGNSCTFFKDFNCQGASLGPIAFPGISDLHTFEGGQFNDVISSYICNRG